VCISNVKFDLFYPCNSIVMSETESDVWTDVFRIEKSTRQPHRPMASASLCDRDMGTIGIR